MKFKFINTQDPEYSKALKLRWEEIQKPLGLPPGSELTPEEVRSIHLLAMEGKKIVGCVLFHPENDYSGRLYQMVMTEEYSGRGFGRRLITYLEKSLFKLGYREITLQAMSDSIHFYQRMGFETDGEVIDKMGIPHHLMRKAI